MSSASPPSPHPAKWMAQIQGDPQMIGPPYQEASTIFYLPPPGCLITHKHTIAHSTCSIGITAHYYRLSCQSNNYLMGFFPNEDSFNLFTLSTWNNQASFLIVLLLTSATVRTQYIDWCSGSMPSSFIPTLNPFLLYGKDWCWKENIKI